jgi:hypothetical protein
MTEQTRPRSLREILDAVGSLGRERDVVSVDDIVQSLGRASTAALLFLPAIVATTPLSGIPGLSALCGIIIVLVSAQALIGRKSLWLPGFVTRRKVDGSRIQDRHTHQRLDFLVRGVGGKVLFAICMLGGMVMPVLEFIPFSASTVAACITLLSVAILTLDGLLAACALGLVVAAAGFLTWLI